MVRRYYSSVAAVAALTSGVNSSDTVLPVSLVTGFPTSVPFTLVLDRGTSSEEIVTVSLVAGLNLTVVRGQDGSAAQNHNAGAEVRHMMTGRDLGEPQAHIDSPSGVHGLAAGVAVVGTTTAQTLTGKILDSANNTLTIRTAALPDATITTAKVADSAITSAKIADGTIVAADLASNAVTTAKILDGAVTGPKVASGAISSGHLATANITDASIGSGAGGFIISGASIPSYGYVRAGWCYLRLAMRRSTGGTLTATSTGGISDLTIFNITDPALIPLFYGVYPARVYAQGGTCGGDVAIDSGGVVQFYATAPNAAIPVVASGNVSIVITAAYPV